MQVVQFQSLAGDLPTESVTVTLSRHFCVSPHVGHARRRQAGIKVQEYLPEAGSKQTSLKVFSQRLLANVFLNISYVATCDYK